MYRNNTVGVVIPVHNEAPFVGEVIATLPSFVDGVYVVDDCSTDDSWEVIVDHADRTVGDSTAADASRAVGVAADGGVGDRTRVVATRHETNRGRGGAVKTGYRLALADGVDTIAVLDGDGQMDPDILHRILDPVASGEADYAKGNRLVSPDHWQGMSGWRLFGNVLLTGLTKVASGYWGMRDPQNGYTAISADALDRLDLDDLYEDYGFLNDMLVRLNVHGMRVVDVPMRAVYGDESSGIRYDSFIPNLSMLLLARFFWRLWAKHVRRSIDYGRTVPAVAASPEWEGTTTDGVVSWLDRAVSGVGPSSGPEIAAGLGGRDPLTLVVVVLAVWVLASLSSRPAGGAPRRGTSERTGSTDDAPAPGRGRPGDPSGTDPGSTPRRGRRSATADESADGRPGPASGLPEGGHGYRARRAASTGGVDDRTIASRSRPERWPPSRLATSRGTRDR